MLNLWSPYDCSMAFLSQWNKLPYSCPVAIFSNIWGIHHTSFKYINSDCYGCGSLLINTSLANTNVSDCLLCSRNQWWKYKLWGPGMVKMMGFGSGSSPNCSCTIGLNHTWKILSQFTKWLYSNTGIWILHPGTKNTFAFVKILFFFFFFALIFQRTYIAIDFTPQKNYIVLNFLLHFCSEHLQLSNLFPQCSVPHSAFKNYLRLGCLSTLKTN